MQESAAQLELLGWCAAMLQCQRKFVLLLQLLQQAALPRQPVIVNLAAAAALLLLTLLQLPLQCCWVVLSDSCWSTHVTQYAVAASATSRHSTTTKAGSSLAH
jgi:hypothetical protein